MAKCFTFVDNINRSLITILIFWLIHQIVEPLTYLIRRVEDLLSKDLLNWVVKANKILIIFFGFAATLEHMGNKNCANYSWIRFIWCCSCSRCSRLIQKLNFRSFGFSRKRFKIGDWIYVEGIIEGIVERIGFRSTVIRKFDKSIATIPNASFAENAVVNISETTNWRISWIITLQYNSTIDQLKNIRNQIEKYIVSSEDFKKGDDTASRGTN